MGERIKQRREKLKLTQRQFAERVHMDPSAISHVEHDSRHLTTEQLRLFAVVLHTTEMWLLHGEGPEEAADKVPHPEKEAQTLREDNARLRGQLDESRDIISMLRGLLSDALGRFRGGAGDAG